MSRQHGNGCRQTMKNVFRGSILNSCFKKDNIAHDMCVVLLSLFISGAISQFVDSCDWCIHILQGCFTGAGTVI